jgi:hypothetical protein
MGSMPRRVFQGLHLAPGLQLHFQFVGLVEVIGDGPLGAADDEDQIGDARRHGRFRRVLDQRLVDDGQHFLGIGLGGGQEAGAHAGGREKRPW